MTLFQLLVRDWQCYFQMAAECSATLIGLMFVVVSQSARVFGSRGMRIVRTFLSPILGYYVLSLMVSALMCMPNQTPLGLGTQLFVVAAIRLGYLVRAFSELRTYHRRKRIPNDKWMHHFLLPGSTTPLFIAAIAIIRIKPDLAIDFLAFIVLFSVVLGITEAWRLTLMMAEMDPEESAQLHEIYGEAAPSLAQETLPA
jgi:hypothetical protein